MKMEKIEINNFESLLKLIENTDLEGDQYTEIIKTTLNVFVGKECSKSEMIEHLKEYWQEYGAAPKEVERPIFIDRN